MTHKENAQQVLDANRSINYMLNHTALAWFRQFFHRRVKCWLCEKICGDKFFNVHASREIDKLTLENERLRAECAK